MSSIHVGGDEWAAYWSWGGKDGRSNGCASACAPLLVLDRALV